MVRLFRVFIPASVIILLISETLLVIGAFVLAAWLNPEADPVGYFREGSGIVNIALVLVTILVGMYLHDLYSDIYVKSHIALIQQLCFVLGAAFLLQAMVSYVDRSLRMPLHVMVPGSLFALVGIYGWRVVFSNYVARVVGGDRLLLVGSSP